ncbi:MAG: hypothetical protein E7016_03040 [Alphaproteobacteria bacterium]|nr:hypothetical protein [Alphaproteobacteria bacterium]
MENKNCMNCGFLCKLRYSAYSELSEDEREKVQQNNSNIINKVEGYSVVDTQRVACYKSQLPTQGDFGPWKQGVITTPTSELCQKQCAFYFPYEQAKGLTLPAIEDKYNQSQNAAGLSISKKALIVASISMVVSILAFLVSIFK